MKISGTLITIAVIIFIPLILLGYAIYYYSHRTIKIKDCLHDNIIHECKEKSPEYEEENINE